MTLSRMRAIGALVGMVALALAGVARASDKPGTKGEAVNAAAAAPAAAHDESGPRTLHGYVQQERKFYDYLLKNHPIFKYEKDGRLVGKYTISDREEEFVEFGGGKDYKDATGRDAAITYRLPGLSILDLPGGFVGSKKCGECHPMQYEKWLKSRHNLVVRFPDEMVEIPGKDLTKTLYSDAAVLPPGITPDAVYAIIGTPRTKYGFLDAWLVRGTYHVEGGLLKDGTGTLVAGGNQHSRTWAQHLTPEVAKQIKEWIPTFPTKLEEFGDSASKQWGMTSYGAKNRKSMMFQPASAYCEVCHSFKFDFKSEDELIAALGKPEELRKHTINKGISCEECHGAGAHLVGARGAGTPSNCERCHQRFQWLKDQKDMGTGAFNAYFKSNCPSCGTEGAQSFFTAHKEKGMSCNTCHDPHEVTMNDWREMTTTPALKKQCEDCHEGQKAFFTKNELHGANKCSSCHMPTMMSCENFAAIQYPDFAGFDAVRTSHIWRIKVDETAKTIVKGPEAGSKMRLAKDKDGKPFVDLMWSCGRTTWSDDDLEQTGGCHSPIRTKAKERLQFRSQKQVYDVVVKWQKPVKDGVAEVKATLAKAGTAILAAKAPAAKLAQAQTMLNQADAILQAIAKDGSSGVHAPKYTLQKVQEAKLLAQGALELVGPKAGAKLSASTAPAVQKASVAK